MGTNQGNSWHSQCFSEHSVRYPPGGIPNLDQFPHFLPKILYSVCYLYVISQCKACVQGCTVFFTHYNMWLIPGSEQVHLIITLILWVTRTPVLAVSGWGEEHSLGASASVPGQYIASTLQGNGQHIMHVPTQYIPSTFRIFLAWRMPSTFTGARDHMTVMFPSIIWWGYLEFSQRM